MELPAFTMKEKTHSNAKRNILELFAVNSKQYKLILIFILPKDQLEKKIVVYNIWSFLFNTVRNNDF